MGDFFVGRQPIFDRQLKVVGYELLYRSFKTNVAIIKDGDYATSEVVMNTFAEIGLQRMVGSQKAFINITRNFFLQGYPILFTPEKVVLEVLEDIATDPEILKSISTITQKGYRIALDDYPFPNGATELLPYTTIVKLDLQTTDRSCLPQAVKFFRKLHIALLAEKVETHQDFYLCKDLGFDYFQGYFLCRPHIVEGHKVSPTRLVVLQLLSRIQDPDVNFNELEVLISQDVNVGYKLLRLVNSAFFGIPTEIKSIRQALAMLGLMQIRGWLSLLLMMSITDKPNELTAIAMIRARMCELLANSQGKAHAETYFLVGLFSVLDALMDMPMNAILESLSLTKDSQEALLYHKGPMGEVLNSVLAYERGDFEQVLMPGFKADDVRSAYIDALDWVRGISESLQ